ncbi:hypothetical protein JYT99_00550 [bacterium AH-315-E09]|nr:hypothetical protein [Alkaliphilus sp. AH-315-G20]MBN4074399.1 hypothetical protein [bacterium AH-315-E09]
MILIHTDIKKQINVIRRIGDQISEKSKEARSGIYYQGYLQKLETKIQRSNIRYFISFYSVWIHLIISFAFVAAVFMLTNNILSLFVAVTVALGAFFLPLVLLQLLADTMKLKIKKVSLDFLITLKNFFITGEKQDIVNALKKTSKYVSEPLKTYLEIFSYEHEHRINPLMCLDNLIMRIDVNELKMYLENMKICFVFGGDVVALTDTFIEEISEMQNIEEQEDVEDKILNMGLYLLLLLNFGVVFFVLNSGTRIYFTENIAGQIVLVLNILISFVIIYTTIKEVGD